MRLLYNTITVQYGTVNVLLKCTHPAHIPAKGLVPKGVDGAAPRVAEAQGPDLGHPPVPPSVRVVPWDAPSARDLDAQNLAVRHARVLRRILRVALAPPVTCSGSSVQQHSQTVVHPFSTVLGILPATLMQMNLLSGTRLFCAEVYRWPSPQHHLISQHGNTMAHQCAIVVQFCVMTQQQCISTTAYTALCIAVQVG